MRGLKSLPVARAFFGMCSVTLKPLISPPSSRASLIQFQDFGAVQELEEAADPVQSLALSDKWLASGSDDNKVRIYDLEDFSLVKELGDATDSVRSVAFSDSGWQVEVVTRRCASTTWRISLL